MKNFIKALIAITFYIAIVGCSSIATNMKPSTKVTSAVQGKSLINFVRPSSIMGGYQDRPIWHEEEYIGTLSSGTMFQYEASPGKNRFLTNNFNLGWSHIDIEIEPGKVYYIKVEAYFDGFMFDQLHNINDGEKDWIGALDIITIEKPLRDLYSERRKAKQASERIKED